LVVMLRVAVSFNVCCAENIFRSLPRIAYKPVVLACMLAMRVPYVYYKSVDELVGLCAHVVDTYHSRWTWSCGKYGTRHT
jgi:hypothetical protein